MRVFPNMVVTAPGDAGDIEPLLEFALDYNGPVSLRYPKASAETVKRPPCAVRLGTAEVYDWGHDGMLVAYGSLFPTCVQAADRLREEGLDVGVINARFIKPLDTETILKAVEQSGFVITVEEGTLIGGFGSAVLEAVNAAGLRSDHVRCLGIPDQFIEHGERGELLSDLGLDVDGIAATAHSMAQKRRQVHFSLEGVPQDE
jgi:1-deoxy-D-xylulose-5-phosphate synthase